MFEKVSFKEGGPQELSWKFDIKLAKNTFLKHFVRLPFAVA